MESKAIFPRVLVRIAGGDFGNLEALNFLSTEPIYSALETSMELKHRSEEAISVLERTISEATEKSFRAHLLAAKRSIAKCKSVNNLSNLTQLAHVRLFRKVKEYEEALKSEIESHYHFEKFFQEELVRGSKAMKLMAQNEVLRKGLGLSSLSLLKAIDSSYSTKDEKGLFKYISRYCAKTTPYSTLTQLALGEARNQLSISSCVLTEETLAPSGYIRVSGSILEWLLIHIMNSSDVSKRLRLRLNPTLTLEGSNYIFLVNFRNIEAFQVLEIAPMLEFIRSVLSANATSLSLIELAGIITQVSLSPEADVIAYLSTLLDTGFIEFDIPASGIDPNWLQTLIHYLSELEVDGDQAKQLFSLLNDLLVSSYTFAKAESGQRHKILADLHLKIGRFWGSNLLKEKKEIEKEQDTPIEHEPKDPNEGGEPQDGQPAENTVEPEAPKNPAQPLTRPKPYQLIIKEESILYEDAKFPGDFLLSEGYLNDCMDLLAEGLRRIAALDQYAHSQENLIAFFEARYLKDAAVPLLSFYRDYYSPGDHRNAQIAANGKSNQRKVSVDEVLKDFENCYDSTRHEYNLRLSDLPANPDRSIGLAASFATFAQIAHEVAGPNHLVLNSIVQGYGKFIGRFLHLFDVSVTEEILRVNMVSDGSRIMAENRDSSFFNANVHPPLLPYEIWAPGSNTMLGHESQIPVTDLIVKMNNVERRLEVWSQKLHCLVQVLDLGFQNPMARSQLFRLLSMLTPNQVAGFWTITNAINNKVMERNKEASSLIVRPRIILENKVIIQRKSWLLQRNLYPQRHSDERDHAYFLRIFTWWKKFKLPDEAFIRMYYQQNNNQQADSQKSKPWRMDDRKPQYFNLRNPLSVTMFGDMLSRVSSSLVIEEMLPRSDQLLTIGGEKRVIEYVLHYYEKMEDR